jgi:hypothetical protein
MVFNVPFSVPLVEYLVLYSSLRFLSRTGMPGWAKPFVVGLAGMVFDFSLDPVAIRQVFQTQEGRLGRWTWYPAPGDAQIFGEPVYNFTGWILICGFAAATFLAGRSWYAKSGYKPAVGLAYPLLAALLALGILVSPLSSFLLWLAPFGQKGSAYEWWMLGIDGALGLGLLLFYTGRKRGALLPFRRDWPAWLVLCGLPLLNLVACVVGGYREIFGLVTLATAASLVTTALMATVYGETARSSGRR